MSCLHYTSSSVTSRAEPFLTPEAFATVFCDDLAIGLQYKDAIAEQIKKQLQDWGNVAEISLQPEDEQDEDEDEVDIDLRVMINVRFLTLLLTLYLFIH